MKIKARFTPFPYKGKVIEKEIEVPKECSVWRMMAIFNEKMKNEQ